MASAADRRKAQNRGVKAGTVRIGAKGKTVRRYNAKTGRWDVTKKNVKPGVQLAKPGARSTKSTKPPASLTKPSSSRVTKGQSASGSRYAAMASRAATSSSSKKWWQQGGGGLVGPNSPLSPSPSRSKPQKGDRRPHGPYGGYETYNGSRWIRDKQK